LILSFNSPIFERRTSFLGLVFRTVNLKTDKILKDYPNLSKHTICVTEVSPSIYTNDLESASFVKELRFTFSKNCLEKNYLDIKSELEKVLLQISKEIALIREDNLARGKLIEAVKCYFYEQSESEHFKSDGEIFKTEFEEDSPVEFWGTFNHSSRNFITDTEKYPWMLVDISEDKDTIW